MLPIDYRQRFWVNLEGVVIGADRNPTVDQWNVTPVGEASAT